MPRTLGVREYARHRRAAGLSGETHAAVRKAIDTGKLSRSVSKDPRGWPRIDPAIADLEWAATTDPAQQRAPNDQPSLFADARSRESRESPEGLNFTRARTVREGYRAQLEGLELRERMGQLVQVSQVKAEAFELGRKLRERLADLPATLGPVLAGMSDPRACEVLIANEIDAVLREMTGRADK